MFVTFFFEDFVFSSNTRSLFSDLNFMRFQFSIFRVRGKKRLLARSIRRRLIVSCSSVRATSAQNRLIYRIGRAAAKRQPTTTEEAAGRKKHTHLIINKRQKGAKDNGNNNLARTHTLVGYNDTSTQHYTLETLAESTPPPIPNPYHTIPTPSHPALYPMPTPEIPSIHPPPQQRCRHRCWPTNALRLPAFAATTHPSAASTSTSSSKSKVTLLRLRLRLHIRLLRCRSRPVRVSGPFIRGQLHRQQFSVVFICHPISYSSTPDTNEAGRKKSTLREIIASKQF